ncbi:VacJ family lipoprotein [Sphingomonas sp. NIBR02145]|uniref:MlaA family lipoprotein n=1 Tax=Sphingomonas sp. NIBR02145 TaxID=3014784 RepID=UPI0022B4740F|nr:VacJ family lipoprotein [Sphingomonas sp. NIBR02145]WHU03652.1 VacJ family lipoprotein [Sphingomonas sp. NIBR02145]
MSVPTAIGALLLASGTPIQAAPPQDVPSKEVPAILASPTSSGAPASQDEAANEIVVSGSYRHTPGDPLEQINALSFALTQKVDDAITAPASRAYKHVVPKPVRSGFRNFLNNLREPVVFANYLLQLKPGKAAETFGRFALNSTIGLGGVIDIAKRCPFNLPWRPNGFSDTLGVYGVGNGPFIFMPLIGPTTVRDLVGGAIDRLVSPIALGGPFRSKPYLIGTNVYRVLDRRAEQEDELARVKASEDPYAARRNLFFEKRRKRLERLKGREASDPGGQPGEARAGSVVPASVREKCQR